MGPTVAKRAGSLALVDAVAAESRSVTAPALRASRFRENLRVHPVLRDRVVSRIERWEPLDVVSRLLEAAVRRVIPSQSRTKTGAERDVARTRCIHP
jgi:hypothetical protein